MYINFFKKYFQCLALFRGDPSKELTFQGEGAKAFFAKKFRTNISFLEDIILDA